MPSVRYQFHDLKPAPASFLEDVLTGLERSPKALPPKYFYDAKGAALFDAICELPEYYPTRTEVALLNAHGAEIAQRVGPGAAIVEYGSGSGRKTRILVAAARPSAYVAIDISREQLREAAAQLADEFPQVAVSGVCADYTQPLSIDAFDGGRGGRRVVFFPGSTIGNFTPAEAHDFLTNARRVAGADGAMLVGVDLKKDRELLHAAYNDAQGVTAAFNLNVLARINGELGGDFDLASFEHHARYDDALGRIEMHLVSTREQTVHVGGREFRFARGESIHTENSYKYSVEDFRALARSAGFAPAHVWIDERRLFSIHYLVTSA
jgi:dimethylhistidine N-methyltransferase